MTPAQLKNLKYGIGGLAVIGLIYFVTKDNGNSSLSAEDPTSNGEVTNPGNTISFNAVKVANELWDEMNGIGFASIISGNGDERDNIFSILKNVNQTQFGQVVTAFGKKGYNTTFGGTYFGFWETIEYHSLQKILKTELLASDYASLRAKYAKYL